MHNDSLENVIRIYQYKRRSLPFEIELRHQVSGKKVERPRRKYRTFGEALRDASSLWGADTPAVHVHQRKEIRWLPEPGGDAVAEGTKGWGWVELRRRMVAGPASLLPPGVSVGVRADPRPFFSGGRLLKAEEVEWSCGCTPPRTILVDGLDQEVFGFWCDNGCEGEFADPAVLKLLGFLR